MILGLQHEAQRGGERETGGGRSLDLSNAIRGLGVLGVDSVGRGGFAGEALDIEGPDLAEAVGNVLLAVPHQLCQLVVPQRPAPPKLAV